MPMNGLWLEFNKIKVILILNIRLTPMFEHGNGYRNNNLPSPFEKGWGG